MSTEGIDLWPKTAWISYDGFNAGHITLADPSVWTVTPSKKPVTFKFAEPHSPLTDPPTEQEHIPLKPPPPVSPHYPHALNYLQFEAWRQYACTHDIALDAGDFWVPRPVPFVPIPDDRRGRARAVRDIAKAFGDGRIIGRGAYNMTKVQSEQWLRAWHNGDLRTCYLVEKCVGKPDPDIHPGGDNHDTWRIVWTAVAADEVPAGQLIQGPWRSPEQMQAWSEQEVANYLLAAKATHVAESAGNARRRWVKHHLKGEQYETDLYAWRKANVPSYLPPLTAKPTYSPVQEQPPGFQACLDEQMHPAHWSQPALFAYAEQYNLGQIFTWRDLVNRVAKHSTDHAVTADDDALRLVTVADQPVLGGQHPKTLLRDQFDREWIFKPAPDPAHRFRPEVEHAAHEVARRWGYRTAASRLVEHDGAYGQVQRRHSVRRDLTGLQVDDIAQLTLQQLVELACEHTLDWALDNDDSHAGNMLELTDGHIVGIDKGRAWRYFGGWSGLSGDESAHSNCNLVYTNFYRAVQRRLLPRHTADQVYLAVLAKAHRMQRLPDTELADIIRTAQANRPHYHPSWYQKPVEGAPTNLDELIDAAITRKNRLAADMHTLWLRIYTDAGWTLPTVGAVAAVNPDGHPIHAGLHSPYLHDAVTASHNWGTATFFAGADLEDAHLILWRERRHDGTMMLRGHGKVRADALRRLTGWCSTNELQWPVPAALPQQRYYHSYIVNIRDYSTTDFRNASLRAVLSEICEAGQRALTYVQRNADRYGVHQATVDMCLYYADIVEQALDPDTPFPTFGQYPYTPPRPTSSTGYLVRSVPATRAKAIMVGSGRPSYTTDGELQLGEATLSGAQEAENSGQVGSMYLITLDTGEQIEFRNTDTNTPLAMCGQLQFTIPDTGDHAERLRRVERQLAVMGLDLTPATDQDLELFYWRHLTSVMRQRVDTGPLASNNGFEGLKDFWDAAGGSARLAPDEETTHWRTAYATLVGADTVRRFCDEGEYLPRFNHLDLRHPTQPNGKPYWNRIDVTDEQCETFQMPSLTYRSGVINILHNGNCLSTEARIRHLATYKSGMSSIRDMNEGSSAFVFTRLNQEPFTFNSSTVYLRPQVMRRTTNYGFNEDLFGQIAMRNSRSFHDLTQANMATQHNNEYLIKNGVSLLDDIEVLVCRRDSHRREALATLKVAGVTHIRGLPVDMRIIVGEWFDHRVQAFRAARFTRRP